MATAKEKKDLAELLSRIEDGRYDNFIPQIISSLKKQQTGVIQVGDKVIVNNAEQSTRHKYNINGSEAIVQKINSNTVTVRLSKLSPIAKRSGVATIGSIWKITPTLVSLA